MLTVPVRVDPDWIIDAVTPPVDASASMELVQEPLQLPEKSPVCEFASGIAMIIGKQSAIIAHANQTRILLTKPPSIISSPFCSSCFRKPSAHPAVTIHGLI
jgi:hypothetical protein